MKKKEKRKKRGGRRGGEKEEEKKEEEEEKKKHVNEGGAPRFLFLLGIPSPQNPTPGTCPAHSSPAEVT